MLTAGLATLHKERFIERQPGTTTLPQDWNGTVLAYYLGHFGSGVTYRRGKRGSSFNGPYATRLVCVILYPLEVGTTIALPESLAVTPYQSGPL